ncbi:MAG: hypothetical protein CME70_11260 [Halobacteriovorax sp.]|nr:hypothetical protein [Halobacteriovorax sp.]
MSDCRKIGFLTFLLFNLVSCEDPSLGQGSIRKDYGENNEARPAFINRLNHSPSPLLRSSASRELNEMMSGPTSGLLCGSYSSHHLDIGPDVNIDMTDEQRAFLESELGPPPPSGGAVNKEIPDSHNGTSDAAKFGYYRYKDGDRRVFGTERTIWRIRAAGKVLAQKGLVMGIGDISQRGGGKIAPHSSHREGRDVDLRLLGSNGKATPCTVDNPSCFSVENTFQMLKAFVDIDPSKVKLMYINSKALRDKINTYYKKLTGTSQNISKYMTGHNAHIHLSWKK